MIRRYLHFLALPALIWLAGLIPTHPAHAATTPPTSTTNPSEAPPRFRRGGAAPNIVLIVADDLGYGDLGCYGQTRIRTPNLDKLAANGIRFTSFYAGSTVCAPSRSCLMTGQHTGHTWIRGNSTNSLRTVDVTLPQTLKSAGYHTAAIGKWGLGLEGSPGHPNAKGFDQWFGFLDQTHAHNAYPTFLWRNDRKVPLPGNEHRNKGDYAPDWFLRAATNYVKGQQFDPFLLYYATTVPHANNERTRLTGLGMEVPSDQPYSREDWPVAEKLKAAMITRLDADVGQLLDLIKRLKLEENTLILFTSDNGPHREGGNDPSFFKSSGPFRGMKRDLYEGGIRVPMIACWPGKIPPGTVSDQPWAFWDLLPTLADLAGVRPPANLDGESMVPLLLGKTNAPPQRFLYWEFHENGFKQAARLGAWKAVRTAANAPLELYNLDQDPAETRNLAHSQPDRVRDLGARMKAARTDSPLWPIAQPPSKPSATSAKP